MNNNNNTIYQQIQALEEKLLKLNDNPEGLTNNVLILRKRKIEHDINNLMEEYANSPQEKLEGTKQKEELFQNHHHHQQLKQDKLHFLTSKSEYSNKFMQDSCTWEELVEAYLNVPLVIKDRDNISRFESDHCFFIPWHMKPIDGDDWEHQEKAYKENGVKLYSRCSGNTLGTQIFVLDYDDGTVSVEDVKELFKDYEYYLHTSYNHLWNKKEQIKGTKQKFHVYFPMLTYCPVGEFKARKEAFLKSFPGVDKQCVSKPSHSYWGPVVNPNRINDYYSYHNKGARWFDWTEFEPTIVKERIKPQVKTTGVYLKSDKLNETITLADNTSYSIIELYEYMQDGYSNRKQCYGLRADNSPGCFVKKEDGKIILIDKHGSNRVWQVEQVNEVLEVVEPPINPNVEPKIIEETTAIKDIFDGTYRTENITVENINVRYLYPAIKDIETDILCLESAKGTGKTVLFSKIVEDCKKDENSVLVLTHRRSLSKSLAKVTNSSLYSRDNVSNYYVCTLDSILNVKDKVFHTIIIDESEQVISHLIGGTLEKNRKSVVSELQHKIAQAKKVVLADADFTYDLSLRIISTMRGLSATTDKIHHIKNLFQPGVDRAGFKRDITLVETTSLLLADILMAIDNGENIYVASNTVRDCEDFVNSILSQFPNLEDKILLVNCENQNEEKQRAFLLEPSKEIKKYQIVLASPTISTGFSIEGKHVNHVFGCFDCITHFSATDCDQALFRVRNTNIKITVYIKDDRYIFTDKWKKWREQHNDFLIDEYETQEERDTRLEHEKQLLRKTLYCETRDEVLKKINQIFKEEYEREYHATPHLYGEKVNLSTFDLFWLKIYSNIKAHEVIGLKNRYEKFIKLNQRNGFNIILKQGDKNTNDLVNDLIQENKVSISDIKAKAILASKDINLETYKELKNKQEDKLSYSELLMREKFWVKSKLPQGVVLSVENIKLIIKDYYKRTNLYFLTLPQEEVLTRDLNDRTDKSQKTINDRSHYIRQQKLLNKMIIECDLSDFTNINDFLSYPSDKFILNSNHKENVELFYNDNFNEIYEAFKLNKMTKEASFGDIWKATMGSAAIPVNSKVIKQNGSSTREHFIDFKKYKIFYDKILEDRNKQITQAQQAAKIDTNSLINKIKI